MTILYILSSVGWVWLCDDAMITIMLLWLLCYSHTNIGTDHRVVLCPGVVRPGTDSALSCGHALTLPLTLASLPMLQ